MYDLELAGEIAALANGKTLGGELMFLLASVGSAIDLCTMREIAVLGIDLFNQKPEGVHCEYDSVYEAGILDETWPGFVESNNRFALAFVDAHPA